VATVAHVVLRYIGLLLFPRSQSLIPPVYPITSIGDPRLLLVAMCFAAIAAVALLARRRAPLVTLGILWFGFALLPTTALGLLADTGLLMAEHRVYLASCGFFLAFAALLGTPAARWVRDVRTRAIFGASAALVIAVLFVLTIDRNRLWANPTELWEEAARLAPDTPAAHLGLGNAYLSNGECNAAQPVYYRVIELSPRSTDAYLGLAECYLRRGQVAQARLILARGAPLVPSHDNRILLAWAGLEESALRRPDEALRLCREAARIDPQSVQAQDCIRRNERDATDGGRSTP
jgi:tetratricopeptide (TPR) repeat protein